MRGATVRSSLIADGCTIGEGAVIENSVIGLRSRIGRDVQIRNSIIMGADYYETDQEREEKGRRGAAPIGIGDGTVIEGAIVDKNCRVGRGVRLVNDGQVQRSLETPHGMVCDGIIVVPKDTALPDGWIADFKQVAVQ
jgi:glucose-1-phosphate adenylyltransferase